MGLVTWGGTSRQVDGPSVGDATPVPGDRIHWLWLVALVVSGLASLFGTAEAQVAWDTPRLIGPNSPGGLGVYWVRSSIPTVESDGLMGTLALPGSGGRVVVRGGATVDAEDQVSVFGGLDVRSSIARHSDAQPLDLEWHAGLGAGGNLEGERSVVVTLPMGISAGRSWSSGSVWFSPYVSAGAAFDYVFGDAAPEDEFTVTPAADVGADLALDAARRLIIRVAASLGDRQALAVGLTLGGGA